MNKYSHALIVGRFQPFHNGHLYVVRKSLELADTITFGIGSANQSDPNNPLNYGQRKSMLKLMTISEHISERTKDIVPLDDFFNDEKWLNNIRKQVPDIGIVVGNNEWTNRILEKAGYPVYRLGFINRIELEGIKIRQLMTEGGEWKRRVPVYLHSYLEEILVPKLKNGENV